MESVIVPTKFIENTDLGLSRVSFLCFLLENKNIRWESNFSIEKFEAFYGMKPVTMDKRFKEDLKGMVDLFAKEGILSYEDKLFKNMGRQKLMSVKLSKEYFMDSQVFIPISVDVIDKLRADKGIVGVSRSFLTYSYICKQCFSNDRNRLPICFYRFKNTLADDIGISVRNLSLGLDTITAQGLIISDAVYSKAYGQKCSKPLTAFAIVTPPWLTQERQKSFSATREIGRLRKSLERRSRFGQQESKEVRA